MEQQVIAVQYQSKAQFEKQFANLIHTFTFKPGSLVLVRNSAIETSHSRKAKLHYFGPMVVIHQTRNFSYVLTKLNGAISKLPYVGYRLVPYHPRSPAKILVTALVNPGELPNDNDLFVFDTHPSSRTSPEE